MSLKIESDASNTPTIKLGGRLDSETAPSLDRALDPLLANTSLQRMVFDLGDLEYLSSAGIRCFIRARKAIEPRGGKVAVINPQPAVRKVLEIVKAIPGGVFRNVTELDAYLDEMQRKVREQE
ncbi:MAG TPA: STAS domain-containing protein [Steroidobacteraceae bacterium]|nr:STAS domain-containing protein [Steroidobacteraceae bacterium]